MSPNLITASNQRTCMGTMMPFSSMYELQKITKLTDKHSDPYFQKSDSYFSLVTWLKINIIIKICDLSSMHVSFMYVLWNSHVPVIFSTCFLCALLPISNIQTVVFLFMFALMFHSHLDAKSTHLI